MKGRRNYIIEHIFKKMKFYTKKIITEEEKMYKNNNNKEKKGEKIKDKCDIKRGKKIMRGKKGKVRGKKGKYWKKN